MSKSQNERHLGQSFFAILALVLITGCSSVRSRIHEHEREFASYSPEAQAQIQNGRIAKGFTEDMVYLAKGEPTDKATMERDKKKITVWHYPGPYSTLQAGPASQALGTPYGYPTFGPNPTQSTPIAYERQQYAVEFEDGKVVRWDPRMQDDPPEKLDSN